MSFPCRHLDYEAAQRHALTVIAFDGGKPPLTTNLTLLVDVQDINDNPPVFERPEYSVNVVESAPLDTQVNSASRLVGKLR
jgi:protocadherin-16/23